MTYRSIHKANQRFSLTVMWGLIAAFLLAMVLMFVHPQWTLVLVWMGLVVLALAVIISKLIRRLERAEALIALQRNMCPSCGAPVHRDPEHTDELECDACGAAFTDTGALRADPTE